MKLKAAYSLNFSQKRTSSDDSQLAW